MRLTLIGCLITAAVACGRGSPSLEPLPTGERGLQVFPTARAYDPPGQIFRVDQNGVTYPELDLGLATQRLPDEFPTFAVSRTSRASLVLGFLGDVVSGTAVGNRVLNMRMEVSGTSRERLQGVVVDSAVRANLSRLRFDDNSRYYVIREAVVADSVTFVINRAAVDSLGGNAKLQQLASARADLVIRASSADTTRLVKRFAQPLRVFYKASLISPGRNLGGGRRDSVSFVEVTTTIDVRSEARRSPGS